MRTPSDIHLTLRTEQYLDGPGRSVMAQQTVTIEALSLPDYEPVRLTLARATAEELIATLQALLTAADEMQVAFDHGGG